MSFKQYLTSVERPRVPGIRTPADAHDRAPKLSSEWYSDQATIDEEPVDEGEEEGEGGETRSYGRLLNQRPYRYTIDLYSAPSSVPEAPESPDASQNQEFIGSHSEDLALRPRQADPDKNGPYS